MSLPAFSIKRPVTTVMIYLGIVLLGVIAWMRLPQELFPPINYPQLTIVTRYKDAAPEEIELLVTKPIEEVAGTVSGLRRISSISKEELSLVIAEFGWDTNMDFAGLGVREKIDLIKERLPRGAEEPVVIKYNPFELPVLVLNLSGKRSPADLLSIARKQIKSELEKVDGVAAVNLAGGLEREILVEVDQGRLQSAGMPISHVVDALSKANMNYPAGTIKEAFYEYLIRTIGEFKLIKEIPRIAVGVDEKKPSAEKELEERVDKPGPLRKEKGMGPGQRLILMNDIATVKDTFREQDSISRFNGRDNVSISIQKQAGGNTVQVVRQIKEAMRELETSLPPDLSLSIAFDQASTIENSIQGVLTEAIQGGFLAFLVLYFLLGNLWSAINVTFAIPISIMAAFALMYFSGLTVNMISMAGLAMGVGMMVDAGIVVEENIARFRMGHAPPEAAVKGTEEVGSAIGGSVLTTIVVFLPIAFVIGITGQMFKDLAFTVTFSLLASWGVSLTLTPLVASWIPNMKVESPIEPVLNLFARIHLALVRWFLHNRIIGTVAMVMVFIGSMMLLNNLDVEVLPRVDQGQFILKVSLPPGTRLTVTDSVIRKVERVLQALPDVRDVTVNIGSSKEKRAEELLETLGSHQGQILVNLWPLYRGAGKMPESGYRLRKTDDIVQELQQTLAREPIEGAEIEYILQDSVFKSALTANTPVVVEVKGTDLKKIEELSGQVKKMLEETAGLYGVKTSIVPPSPETKVHVLKDRASTYHLSVSDIALTAQTAFKGFVATKFKEEGKEVDVRVRLRKEDREDINKIGQMMVHSPLEIDIPLADVAYLDSKGKGPTEIRRLDQQRTVLISAQLHKKVPLNKTLELVESQLKKLETPSGCAAVLTGEQKQIKESKQSLTFALILSILLVYMVMASEFESLWQPFLIMATMPMSLIGVAWGLWLTHTPISIMAGLGLIILGGVVVDNGIVLIEFVNQLREEGKELEEAVIDASQERLRPILMTSVTTILGLVPMALGWQQGVEMQIPMAITVMGGLTVSTFLTLFFLPTVYVMGAEFFEGIGKLFFKNKLLSSYLPVVAEPVVATAAVIPAVAVEMPIVPENPVHAEPVSAGGGPASGAEAPARPEEPVAFPEIPEGFGGEDAVPDRPEAPPIFPTLMPPEPESPEEPPSSLTSLPKPTPEDDYEEELPEESGGPSAPLGEPGQLPPLNSRQERLIVYLKERGRITRKEYVDLTGASVPTAARDLKELADRGLIKGIGPLAKGRYYVLT